MDHGWDENVECGDRIGSQSAEDSEAVVRDPALIDVRSLAD